MNLIVLFLMGEKLPLIVHRSIPLYGPLTTYRQDYIALYSAIGQGLEVIAYRKRRPKAATE